MSYMTDLASIRDNIVAEFKGETARRAALVAAGHPAPTTYSVGGKTLDWNGYMSLMLARIREANELVIAAGGDGGLYEEHLRGYSS